MTESLQSSDLADLSSVELCELIVISSDLLNHAPDPTGLPRPRPLGLKVLMSWQDQVHNDSFNHVNSMPLSDVSNLSIDTTGAESETDCEIQRSVDLVLCDEIINSITNQHLKTHWHDHP